MLDGGGHVMVSGNVGVDMHYGCGFTMLGLALVHVLLHGPLLKGNSMPCVPVDTQSQQCPFQGEGLWEKIATFGITPSWRMLSGC